MIPPPPPPPPIPAALPIISSSPKESKARSNLLYEIREGVKLKKCENPDELNKSKNCENGYLGHLDTNNNSDKPDIKNNPQLKSLQAELSKKLKNRNEGVEDEIQGNQILSPSLRAFVQNKTKPLQRENDENSPKLITHAKRNFNINKICPPLNIKNHENEINRKDDNDLRGPIFINTETSDNKINENLIKTSPTSSISTTHSSLSSPISSVPHSDSEDKKINIKNEKSPSPELKFKDVSFSNGLIKREKSLSPKFHENSTVNNGILEKINKFNISQESKDINEKINLNKNGGDISPKIQKYEEQTKRAANNSNTIPRRKSFGKLNITHGKPNFNIKNKTQLKTAINNDKGLCDEGLSGVSVNEIRKQYALNNQTNINFTTLPRISPQREFNGNLNKKEIYTNGNKKIKSPTILNKNVISEIKIQLTSHPENENDCNNQINKPSYISFTKDLYDSPNRYPDVVTVKKTIYYQKSEEKICTGDNDVALRDIKFTIDPEKIDIDVNILKK